MLLINVVVNDTNTYQVYSRAPNIPGAQHRYTTPQVQSLRQTPLCRTMRLSPSHLIGPFPAARCSSKCFVSGTNSTTIGSSRRATTAPTKLGSRNGYL